MSPSLFFDPAAAAVTTTVVALPPGDDARLRPIMQAISKRTRSKTGKSDAIDVDLAPAKRRRRAVAKYRPPLPTPPPLSPPPTSPSISGDDDADEAANAPVLLLRTSSPANDDYVSGDGEGRVSNDGRDGSGHVSCLAYQSEGGGEASRSLDMAFALQIDGLPSLSMQVIEKATKPKPRIGARISKVFKGDEGDLSPFVGAVESYDEEHDLSKVVHEVGDTEELTHEEVSNFFVETGPDVRERIRAKTSPPVDHPSTDVRVEISDEASSCKEVTRLRRELQTMRSERDIAVIELAHLETRYDALVRKRAVKNALFTKSSGEFSWMQGPWRGESGPMWSNEGDNPTSQAEENTESGSAENGMESHCARAESEVSDAISTTDTERGDTLVRLHAEIETLKRQLLEAASRIESLSAEKVALVTRIASALEPNIAEILRSKDNALNVAESLIAALKNSTGGFNDSFTSSAAAISSEEGGHLTVTAEDRCPSDDLSISPRRRYSNTIRPKSAMMKLRNSSSLSLGSGRVSFDRDTSFDRIARLPTFDLFSSPAHGKENFGKKNKKLPFKSSLGGDGNVDRCSPSSAQTLGRKSCEGSNVGRRRKKYHSSKTFSLPCFDIHDDFL